VSHHKILLVNILSKQERYFYKNKQNLNKMGTNLVLIDVMSSIETMKTQNKRRIKMKSLDVIVAVLLVVGGLNWGLVGILNFDLVAGIFGSGSFLARIVYALVGLSAIYQAMQWKAIQRRWLVSPASA
jgi:uncharacterized membrane protein YuzA (DUF378 family)